MSFLVVPLLLADAIAMPVASEANLYRFTGGYSFSISSFEFFVDADGVVLECADMRAVSSDADPPRFCNRVLGRDMGHAARDGEGSRVFSVVNGEEIFGPPFDARALSGLSADLVISVASMPYEQPRVRTAVIALIDETGKIASCAADSELGEVACQQVASHSFDIRADRSGDAVKYVNRLIVDFLLEAKQ